MRRGVVYVADDQVNGRSGMPSISINQSVELACIWKTHSERSVQLIPIGGMVKPNQSLHLSNANHRIAKRMASCGNPHPTPLLGSVVACAWHAPFAFFQPRSAHAHPTHPQSNTHRCAAPQPVRPRRSSEPADDPTTSQTRTHPRTRTRTNNGDRPPAPAGAGAGHAAERSPAGRGGLARGRGEHLALPRQ